jgi:hypothetical protein
LNNNHLDHDTRLILEKLNCEFPIPPAKEFEGWFVPALDVLDCVLSLNRSYDRFCLPRVTKFANEHPKITTLEGLLKLIQSYPTPLDFSVKELNYRDERRAATLVGVLKALLQAQKAFKHSEETSRLKAWAHSVKPTDYAEFGVRGFGLSGFQYLRMLFGVQTVKPDVHICRFVSDAVGRRVGDEEALVLMEAAGEELDWPLSRLDYAIWDRAARGNENPKKQRSASEIVLKVGAEGGSLTLLRKRVAEAEWWFGMERNEEAIYDLLDEEDRPKSANYFSRTKWVCSFQEGLNLLDKYPWFNLYPLYVHPEFFNAVLFEVGTRGGTHEAARWRQELKQI